MAAPDQNLRALLGPQPGIYGGAGKSKGLKHCVHYETTKCERCDKYKSGPKGGKPILPKGKKNLDPDEENNRRRLLILKLGGMKEGKALVNDALEKLGYADSWKYVSATGFDKAYRKVAPKGRKSKKEKVMEEEKELVEALEEEPLEEEESEIGKLLRIMKRDQEERGPGAGLVGGCGCCGASLLGGARRRRYKGGVPTLGGRYKGGAPTLGGGRSAAQRAATALLVARNKEYMEAKKMHPNLRRSQFFAEMGY